MYIYKSEDDIPPVVNNNQRQTISCEKCVPTSSDPVKGFGIGLKRGKKKTTDLTI